MKWLVGVRRKLLADLQLVPRRTCTQDEVDAISGALFMGIASAVVGGSANVISYSNAK